MKHSKDYTSSSTPNITATGFRDRPERPDRPDSKKKPRVKSSAAKRAKKAARTKTDVGAVFDKGFNVYQQPWQSLGPNDSKVHQMASLALGPNASLPVNNPSLLVRSALSLFDKNELKFICSQRRIDQFPDDYEALQDLIINSMINQDVVDAAVATVGVDCASTVTPDAHQKCDVERYVTCNNPK